MDLAKPLRGELKREAAATRRLLERMPEGKLSWRPHERSMSLGRLGAHIAELVAWGSAVLNEPLADLAGGSPAVGDTVDEILAAFDRYVVALSADLERATNDSLLEPWRLVKGETTIMEARRVAALRGFILSHIIHHRGQLTVYLRLLDVPLPGVYGSTADEKKY